MDLDSPEGITIYLEIVGGMFTFVSLLDICDLTNYWLAILKGKHSCLIEKNGSTFWEST